MGNQTSANVTSGRLVATGHDILFWEFGTGIVWSPHPEAERLGVEPASFSRDHAQWLVGEKLEKFKGKWPYRGNWIYGQPPRAAMWGAAKYMREHIHDVAAEIKIFRKGRGRPTNWDSSPSGGITIKGLGEISNHIRQLAEFTAFPDDPTRLDLVRSLLRLGESYASATIGPGENVIVKSEVL